MRKNAAKNRKEVKQTKGLPTAGLVSIIVALIGCLGTFAAALIGYFGLRYQVDQPTKIAETVEVISQLDITARIMSNSWNIALVLPNDVSPEQNSYSTLIQYPEFDNWLIAPIPLSGDSDINVSSGKLLQAEITLGNSSANNGSWIKIGNKINITLDLVSPNIDDHVNLVFVKSGSGGAVYKYFSPIKLDQNTSLVNQTIASKDYDFFSLQPGESDVFILEFICEAPGIYQASAKLSVISSSGEEIENVSGFGKIMCPKSYTLWNTVLALQAPSPLIYDGEYYWDGNRYIMKP